MSTKVISKKKFRKVIHDSLNKYQILPEEIKDTIFSIEDHCLSFFNNINNLDMDTIIDNVIDSIIKHNEPKIIIEHYLIIQRIKNDYNGNYSNGFFNKLFFKLYIKFPQTILALFIELPNYQFFYYFLIFLLEKRENNICSCIGCPLMKLYNLIILLYSIQINKDYRTVNFNKFSDDERPIISNVSLYSPCNKDLYTSSSLSKNNIHKELICDVSTKDITMKLSKNKLHKELMSDIPDKNIKNELRILHRDISYKLFGKDVKSLK